VREKLVVGRGDVTIGCRRNWVGQPRVRSEWTHGTSERVETHEGVGNGSKSEGNLDMHAKRASEEREREGPTERLMER
jgi:hypothetical protein